MSWLSRLTGGTGGGRKDSPGLGDSYQPTLKPGDRIANEFVIIELVGQGQFGAVYRCHSPEGEVAIKLLLNVDSPEERQRIKEEARRWAELGVHPNLVLAYGVREHARVPCIVMEYVPGASTLADVAGAGRGDWRGALWIGARAAAGLDHAWRTKRLLHRDIKPANILVTPDWIAKMGDFGLATSSRLEADQLRGMRIGTPLYMAPEIWDSGAAGPAGDIYAFGVTLYEAAAGFWPYSNEQVRSFDDLANAHHRGLPPHLSAVATDIDKSFAGLVMECLHKRPDRRPSGFDAIADKLNTIARSAIGQDARKLGPSRHLTEAERLTNLVTVHLAVGDVAQARVYAERAVSLDRRNPKVWTGLSAVNGAQGRPRDAIKALRQALDLNPDPETELVVLRDLAQGHYLLGEKGEATRWLMQAIAHVERSNRFALLDGRSNLIVDLLPFSEAQRYCERILSADPNAAITWNNLAIGWRRNNDVYEAERCARRAVELNPLYAKAWTNLANALVMQERYEEAIDAAKRSIEIEPKTGGAYTALFSAYMTLGREREALHAINEGARLVPDNPQIQQALALMRSRR